MGGIYNGVHNRQGNGVDIIVFTDHAEWAQDAVINQYVPDGVSDRNTRLFCPSWMSIGLQRPTRHQGAMAKRESTKLALDFDSTSGNQKSVQRQRTST